MRRRRPRCGQPLVALVVVLGGWVTARTAAWESAGQNEFEPAVVMALAVPGLSRKGFVAGQAGEREPASVAVKSGRAQGRMSQAPQPAPSGYWPQAAEEQAIEEQALAMRSAPAVPIVMAPTWTPDRQPAASPDPVRTTVGHQLLWLAAVSRLPMPYRVADLVGRAERPQPFYPVGREPAKGPSRWSADGWLLLRDGGSGRLAAGGTPASYGASQAGAVLRYRLAPGNPHRPAVYLRASAALDGSREREAALGLSARPLARLPVIAAAEVRATSSAGGTRLRPAVMAITELPLVKLPHGARLEVYGQAGYVGGRDATAFADGQLRVDRQFGHVRQAEVRAGFGSWAGAQRGASRVDIGPSVTLGVPAGGSAAMRLSMDWRFRVAGQAAPASGPALTLSAGF